MNNNFKNTNCDMFSKFNEKDQDEVVNSLTDLPIEYREELNIKLGTTFGLELEFEDAKFNTVVNEINTKWNNWKIENDASVQRLDKNFEQRGGEVISPILTNTKENWTELKEICQMLRDNEASCFNNSSSHIHLGRQILGSNEDMKNFLKLWAVYEDIIYKFSFGKKEKYRSNLQMYARPLANTIVDNLSFIDQTHMEIYDDILITLLAESRHKGLNLTNLDTYKQTLEFRCPNGTLEENMWQNNVNFFYNLANHVTTKNFDTEKLDKLINDWNFYNVHIDIYCEEKKQKALELADMIFDNNLDKAYFLKQYLKKFSEADNVNNKIYTFKNL